MSSLSTGEVVLTVAIMSAAFLIEVTVFASIGLF